MINTVILGGRLGKDGDIRTTAKGSMALCSIAVNQYGKDKPPMWVRVTLFTKVTDNVLRSMLRKGSLVVFEGRVNINAYEDKNGQKREELQITANNFHLITSKSEVAAQQDSTPHAQTEELLPEPDLPEVPF